MPSFEQMKAVASKRTKTPWHPIVEKLYEFEGQGRDGKGHCQIAYVVTPDTPIIDEKQIEADGEFVQLAHATYDKLLAVAIAAKYLDDNFYEDFRGGTNHEARDALTKALKELDGEK